MLLRGLTRASYQPWYMINFPPSALKSRRSGLVELMIAAICVSPNVTSWSKSSEWKSQAGLLNTKYL
jgi:hypothetical protein